MRGKRFSKKPRKKMSRRASKKMYKKGMKSHVLNFNPRTSRGGIRL